MTVFGRRIKASSRNVEGRASCISFVRAAFALLILLLVSNVTLADGWNESTKAQNEILNNEASGIRGTIGGIANTRHNLTMSYSAGVNSLMDGYRNDYYEICVYCHTPHGANSTAAAPLWNRTVSTRKYTLYNQDSTTTNEPTATGQAYSQPGPNSLTCLSCHDGATAIDSIINMPTQIAGAFSSAQISAGNNRAGYNVSQESSGNGDPINQAFLDTWSGNNLGTQGPGDFDGSAHAGFASGGTECIICHNAGIDIGNVNLSQGPNFDIFVIGGKFLGGGTANDFLADDHPIGVTYPTKFDASTDYNEPDIKTGRIAYFDNNGNAHADPDEIRLYDTGDGYEVECGSCHDPHGVKVENSNSNNIVPSFLRVGAVTTPNSTIGPGEETRSNVGSSLCLTCHVK